MSQPQHMTALKLANARRLARAELHAQVRTARDFNGSCRELAEILAAGVPECMGGMRVEEALRWVRRPPTSFDEFVDQTLEVVGCTEWKLLRDLSLRQRTALVRELRWIAYADWRAAA